MIKKINYYLKQDTGMVKSSLVLFISTSIMNFLAYFYHFLMGRFLGPADYGVLGSLLSLVYLIVIPLNTIQTTITKFTSNFKAKREYGKINYLLLHSIKKLFLYGIVIVLIFLLLSESIANFLNLPSIVPLIFLSTLLLSSLLLPVTRGVLQGMQKFNKLGSSYIYEGATKLLAGIILVMWIPLRVNGAISAFVLATLIPFLITLLVLGSLLPKKQVKFNTRPVYKYSIPVLIMMLGMTAVYSIDMLLVKHFFNPTQAGYYAAISLLGKIIFFASFAISMVMFSKASESYAAKKNPKPFLYKSLLLVLLISLPMVLFYFIFPGFTVNLLFGRDYLVVKNLLGPFAIVMLLFSLTYVITSYLVSIHQTKFLYLLISFNLLEALLILFFHNTLLQVVQILIMITIVLFVSMFLIAKFQKNETFTYNTSI